MFYASIQMRVALFSYQDHHMLLLTLAGSPRRGIPKTLRLVQVVRTLPPARLANPSPSPYFAPG